MHDSVQDSICNCLFTNYVIPFIHGHLGGNSTLAQSKSVNGYVVDNKGDTTKGYIIYKDWSANPRIIEFATGNNGQGMRHIAPVDIREFMVEGDHPYRSYLGLVNTNRLEIGKLMYIGDRNFSKSITWKRDTVFLSLVVKGKINLYELEDFKFHYFLQKDNDSIVELINKFYLQVKNGIDYKINDKIYLKQMDSIFRGENLNSVSYEDLMKTEYLKSDIAKIVDRVNGLDS